MYKMRNNTAGKFVRWESTFRNWVTIDGTAGPSGEAGFKAESGRYHLYVSHACPWAHRTMIFRKLKGLEEHITVSVVDPLMPAESWVFGDYPGSTPDHVHGFSRLADLYDHVDPSHSSIVTVPVLYDRQQDTIVNNESSEIIRMLNSAFNEWGDKDTDFYPHQLRQDIDRINEFVYHSINNGVYKTGFATTQSAYEQAFHNLFQALDELEGLLSRQRYLVSDRITEADWRLFTTLVRFDPVYVGHFKCNLKRLVDYPNLWAYTRELYQQPGVAGTVHMDHIKDHYYKSHVSINPTRIVPIGPELNFDEPHGRDSLS